MARRSSLPEQSSGSPAATARHLTSQHSSLEMPATHEMPESRVSGADVEPSETPEG